jgi:hypothetical protein
MVLGVVSCDGGGDDGGGSVSEEGFTFSKGGTTYTFEFSRTMPRSTFEVRNDDYYRLTITKADGTILISTGRVTNVRGGSIRIIELTPDEGGTIYVTFAGTTLVAVDGNIPVGDGDFEPGPGTINDRPPGFQRTKFEGTWVLDPIAAGIHPGYKDIIRFIGDTFTYMHVLDGEIWRVDTHQFIIEEATVRYGGHPPSMFFSYTISGNTLTTTDGPTWIDPRNYIRQ